MTINSTPFKFAPGINYSYKLIDLYAEASTRMIYSYIFMYALLIPSMSLFVPMPVLWFWGTLAVMHLLIRYYITGKMRQLLESNDTAMDKYLRWSIYTAAFSGILWGSLSWINLEYFPQVYHYISIAIILGIAAAAIATLSMIFIAYLTFLLSMMSTLILVFALKGDDSELVLSVMLFVYVLVIIPTAKLLYKRTSESFRLSETLQASEIELENLNSTLVQRVEEKTEELKYNYLHDQLTGLPNIQSFFTTLKTEKEGFIAILDIREFSILHKQYGKLLSDNILVAVAGLLRRQLQPGISLFRGESDRFIFYFNAMQLERVEGFIEQVISFFEVYQIEVEQLELFVTFRVGISDMCGDEESLVHAEHALMMAKRKSKNSYVYDMSQKDLQAEKDIVDWLGRTKELILSEGLRPFFQPIYDIKQKKIMKYECLARGEIDGKLIAPYKFLNAAERLDLTKNITRVMIDKSFSFFKNNNYSFSINLTGADLLDQDFINYLKLKLKRYEIDPSRVIFEILENITTYSSGNVVLESLHSIKACGCKLAIDDFGVESSNFSRLLEIDLDFIKIDGLFIKNLLVNEKDKKVVKAIVGLAQTLGVETIAEFVENKEVFDALQECGVDYAQGYHIGKPEEYLLP